MSLVHAATMVNIGDKVFPGDVIPNLQASQGVTVLGPGLSRLEDHPNQLAVTRPGQLSFKPPNTYWIDGAPHHYNPKRGDLVVGIVMKKSGDSLRVDIGGSELAGLSMFAFEGATKKLKPDVQVGDVVYARLLNAHREMEPELVCVDSYYKAGKLGVLSNDGFVVTVGVGLATRLLSIDSELLRTLGRKFPYEVAIGVNGRVWINARSCTDVMTVVRALEAAQLRDITSINNVCRQLK